MISKGADAIQTYFKDLPESGRRNVIVERHTVMLGPDAVLVTGFYDNKAVWPLFGYEGSSWEKGGYLNRGFDDIDWLDQA